MPLEESKSLVYIFFSGAFAISAFLLPGISGSFVLLILGAYHLIMNSLKSFIEFRDMESLIVISVFSLGIFFGIITISRVLNFLFKKWKKSVMIFLIGVIFGSLVKLWP